MPQLSRCRGWGPSLLNNPWKASGRARESLLTRPARLCEAAKNSSFLSCEEIEKERKRGHDAERTTHARKCVCVCGGGASGVSARNSAHATCKHAHAVAREGKGDWLRARAHERKRKYALTLPAKAATVRRWEGEGGLVFAKKRAIHQSTRS